MVWFALPERNMTKYSIADELAAMARDRYEADWIIYCDVDEFVCTHGKSLRTVLAECDRDGITLLDLPRRTMTGPLIPPGRRATEVLTLRIDRTVVPTTEQLISWDFPVPFAFLEVGGHVAVRAAAIRSFASGMHDATVTWGTSATSDLYILHYAIRGYEELRQKVRNTEKWLEDNPHLPPGWGWHWRRWIQLEKAGRLREDYERQFVSAERANELVADGTCAVDTTITAWLAEQEDAPGCGRPSMVRLAPAGRSSLEAGPTKRDAIMPGAVPIMRPKLPAASSVLPYLSDIDASRIYSNFGPLAIRLEHRLAAHFRVGDHAVTTVANATLGLALALSAQQVTAGTLCVIPAWTFVASPQAARLAGLTPYFVDVDPRTWALEPDAIDDIIAECSRRGRCGHAGRALRPADRSARVGSIPLANRVSGGHRRGRGVRCCCRHGHARRRQPACHEGARDG